MNIVDNAVIMAAGTSSRFAPLSYEMPKALVTVKGEVLIERQIKQLQEVGINDIYIVTGYKSEMFEYLCDKFGVKLVHNPDYLVRNNNSSLYVIKEYLNNTYICSADNYFPENPFEKEVDGSYYSAVYADGETKEWCMEYDENDIIRKVTVGGENAWYMLGHAFFDEKFSKTFKNILEAVYDLPETVDLFWENIYINNIAKFEMKIRKYYDNVIFEFDSLDELRTFDTSYINDTRSKILKDISKELQCEEKDIVNINVLKNKTNEAVGFTFDSNNKKYSYLYDEKILKEI